MKTVFVVIILVSACFSSEISYGFNQAQLDSLLATKRCEYCDLRNADLTGASLSGAKLSGANLTGAKLSKASLSDANLYGAVLTNADLENANLTGAYMRGAKLTGARLNGANLTKANMEKANLLDADLTSIILSETNLTNVTWKDGTRCEGDSVDECKKPRGITSPHQSSPTPGTSAGAPSGGAAPGIPF